MMLLRVVDFECSGIKPPEAAICEIGMTDVFVDGGPAQISPPFSMLINPGHPIPADVRAIHHISNRDVAGAPSPEEGLQVLTAANGKGTPSAFVAHHAEYDRQFFGGGGVPWICTRKVAMRVWPEAPNHKNQTLRYWLNVDDDTDFERLNAAHPHRAGADAYTTAFVLRRALEKATPEQMIEWSNQPSLLPGSINFGKHKGTPWPQVEGGYLEWLLRQPDMDSDTAFTARYWLDRRRCDAR